MTGETDLIRLLATMEPVLGPETYVFATLEQAPDPVEALMRFEEAEGTTLILTQGEAQRRGIEAAFPCRRITLNVHSALEAVGFIARIATALAAKGMGVNPVSGFFHDHLFVPEDRVEDAMTVLAGMIEGAQDR